MSLVTAQTEIDLEKVAFNLNRKNLLYDLSSNRKVDFTLDEFLEFEGVQVVKDVNDPYLCHVRLVIRPEYKMPVGFTLAVKIGPRHPISRMSYFHEWNNLHCRGKLPRSKVGSLEFEVVETHAARKRYNGPEAYQCRQRARELPQYSHHY